MTEVIAWFVLRIVFAGMFLMPLPGLLRNFEASVDAVKLVVPLMPRFFAVLMMLVMFCGAMSILMGFYAQIAGFFLLIYCLMGVIVHYRLAGVAAKSTLSQAASDADSEVLQSVVGLAVMGNQTSGQKNIVLAAVACFFLLMGSGPWSLNGPLF